MSLSALRTALPLLALTLPAAAQSLNVDVGSVLGVPSSSYAAAAGQAGVWNQMPDGFGTALVDLAGQPTGAGVSALGANFAFWSNNAGTTGDDELLLDDACDGGRIYTFSGLQPGNYQIYTFAWAPDDPTYTTNVSVQGSPDPDQVVGGVWAGAHQLGVTYALHNVTAAGGQIVVTVSAASGFSTVNGFQLVDQGGGCPASSVYCTPKTTSGGCVPALSTSGVPSVTAGSGFVITASQVDPGNLGVLFYGTSGPAAVPFQGGFLCVQPPVLRSAPQSSGGAGACSGAYVFDFNQYVALGVDPALVVGAQVNAQFWFRDPPDPVSGTGLSQGVEFVLCP